MVNQLPIPIPLPLRMSYPTVNATLIPGEEPVLIDCGLNMDENLRVLSKALQDHGYQISDISRVLITHPHVDHIGLSRHLSDAGAEIWMSDLAFDWIRDLKPNREALIEMMLGMVGKYGFDNATRKLVDGYYRGLSDLFPEIPEQKIHIFSVGDELPLAGGSVKVIYAPGHSNRQVCLYQADSKTLFSADMLLPKTPVPVIEPELQNAGKRYRGLPEMLASYLVFREMDIENVFPGHGEAFTNHRRLIDRQIERIHLRAAECHRRIGSGTNTLPGLLAEMYRYLPPADRLGGLAMLIGYLDLLMDEEKVRRVEENGVWSFEI